MYRSMYWQDPGLRSGWATWTAGRNGNTFACGIADPEELCDIAERWANQHAGKSALMGSESFHITEETAHKDQAAMGWPLELLGVCRYLARRNEITFDTQSPADGKGFGTDYKLRKYGMWTPGPEDHARDASRHLLTALLTRRIAP